MIHRNIKRFQKIGISYAAFVLGLGLSTGYAQALTIVSGGDASGIGGTVSYSIGQVIYSSSIGTEYSISNGVQQPYEISVLTAVDNAELNYGLSVYPNPTMNKLLLNIEKYNQGNLSYQLFPMGGKLLEGNSVTGKQTVIDTSLLPSGNYILNISQDNQTIQSFKIIKK